MPDAPDPHDQTAAAPPPLKPPHNDTRAHGDHSPTTGEYELKPDSDEFPATIGSYQIEKLLGEGGMGSVYLAEDASLERKVALKVMKATVAANPLARERFVREAKAAAKVESDHIIRVYQVGEDRGMPFIAMEYLKGKPMDSWIKESKASIKQILRIGYETALGLSAAHKAGLIHRDIKPANLWLEAPTGRIKILDFGLARPSNEETHLTQSGVVVGTPAYMSPEQGRGKDLDHRTDIFSLGCVLYHLATGKRPFTGSNTYEVIASLIADTPEAPHTLNPAVTVELSNAIMGLLEKDAAKRPANARAVAETMQKILKGLNQPKDFVPLPAAVPVNPTPMGTPADKTTAWENLDESGSEALEVKTADAVKLPKIVKVKPPRRSRMMWIIGSAVASLFVVIASAVLIHQYLNKPKEIVEAVPPPRTLPTAKAIAPPPTVATKPAPTPVVQPVEPVGTLPPDLAKLKGGEEAEFEIADNVKMKFCWIPPGKAMLGSPATEKDRREREVEHEYTSTGFWLGKYPVTQSEYQAIIGKNPSDFSATGSVEKRREAVAEMDTTRFPVENVTWHDCQNYLKRLNMRVRFAGKFSLPNEDQWEYACRGGLGNSRAFYWGDTLNGNQANCRGENPYGTDIKGPFLWRTSMVGAYEKIAPHSWGLCDMCGNVRNWCDSLYSNDSGIHILRGGAWSSEAHYCRVASRNNADSAHLGSYGFRVAFIPDLIKTAAPLDLAKVTPADLAKFKGGEEADYEIAAGVKMRFNWIPPGKATLGSPATEKDRGASEIEHEYTSKGYWLGKHPVTQGEYQVVIGKSPSHFTPEHEKMKAEGIADISRFPVEQVSWNDCQEYLKKLNAKGDFQGKFKLPHEDEWEYACRGGKGNFQPFYWGNASNGEQANCQGTKPYGTSTMGPLLGRTTEVGAYAKFAPHPWGLCDMAGNVRNWCVDLYSNDPIKRALRGGSWCNMPQYCRAANLYGREPDDRDYDIGFRLILPGPDSPLPSGNPPLDPDWVKRAGALPPQGQFEEVKKEIIRRNPGFEKDGVFESSPDHKSLQCYSRKLIDIHPLAILKQVEHLKLTDTQPDGRAKAGYSSSLSDISPLGGLKLQTLNISATQVSDLSVVGAMPLKYLYGGYSQVSDLAPLKDKVLEVLHIPNTNVTTIVPLGNARITQLVIEGNPQLRDLHLLKSTGMKSLYAANTTDDLTFLRGSSLTRIRLGESQIRRNAALLKSIKTIALIEHNGKSVPATDYWKEWDEKFGFPPLPAGWVERVKALPEAGQLAEIKAEIIKRNPDFEKDGVFAVGDRALNDKGWLFVQYAKLKDISPLAAVTCRTKLGFVASDASFKRMIDDNYRCELENLTPLENLPLTDVNISRTRVVDLTPLQNMKLTRFEAVRTDLRDISPLAGMPITYLTVDVSKVTDIAACKGMPLKYFAGAGTPGLSSLEPLRGKPLNLLYVRLAAECKDISALTGMPLMVLSLNEDLLKANPKIVETMRPTLKEINGKPAEEFWKGVGK